MEGQRNWLLTSKRSTRNVLSEEWLGYLVEMLEKPEALQRLKVVLKETHRPDTDYNIELSRQRLFWVITPKSYDHYGTGLGHWVVHRETEEVEAHNPHIDPDDWEEIYLDTQDSSKIWIIRFDSSKKNGIIDLKRFLGISLGEAKALAESLHWFSGHRVQLESVQHLLLENGITTQIKQVINSDDIKKLKAFPHVVIFIEDVIRMIKHEDSHWWEV